MPLLQCPIVTWISYINSEAKITVTYMLMITILCLLLVVWYTHLHKGRNFTGSSNATAYFEYGHFVGHRNDKRAKEARNMNPPIFQFLSHKQSFRERDKFVVTFI